MQLWYNIKKITNDLHLHIALHILVMRKNSMLKRADQWFGKGWVLKQLLLQSFFLESGLVNLFFQGKGLVNSFSQREVSLISFFPFAALHRFWQSTWNLPDSPDMSGELWKMSGEGVWSRRQSVWQAYFKDNLRRIGVQRKVWYSQDIYSEMSGENSKCPVRLKSMSHTLDSVTDHNGRALAMEKMAFWHQLISHRVLWFYVFPAMYMYLLQTRHLLENAVCYRKYKTGGM